MSRTVAKLPAGSRITDYISLGVVAQALRTEGEVNYDQSRVAASLNWIQSNPIRFRQLTMSRLRHFFPPARVGLCEAPV